MSTINTYDWIAGWGDLEVHLVPLDHLLRVTTKK